MRISRLEFSVEWSICRPPGRRMISGECPFGAAFCQVAGAAAGMANRRGVGSSPIRVHFAVPSGTAGRSGSPECPMNKLTRYLYRAPGSSLRLAGGLGLLSLLGTAAPMSAASPMFADISINIGLDLAPPPLRHEVIIGVSPGPDYVWLGGFWAGSRG